MSSAVLEKPVEEKTVVISPAKTSLQAYFDLEKTSEIRHEFVEGDLISMPGESLAHNRIALNLSSSLLQLFEDRPCEVYMEGIRARVSLDRYRYPDVVALCGEPLVDTDNPPSLLNPMLIVEVLSPSTRATDYGDKSLEYRHIPSLTDYLLVEQDRVFVTHCTRQSEHQWLFTEYFHPDDTLIFASLETSLTLASIYRKVSFSEVENESNTD